MLRLKQSKLEADHQVISLENQRKRQIQQMKDIQPDYFKEMRLQMKRHYRNEDFKVTDIFDVSMPIVNLPDLGNASFINVVLQVLVRIKVIQC